MQYSCLYQPIASPIYPAINYEGVEIPPILLLLCILSIYCQFVNPLIDDYADVLFYLLQRLVYMRFHGFGGDG
jgi:hypothetical protein